MHIILYLIFRIYIYLTGIKFFKTDLHPITEPIRKATFTTINGDIISFSVFKEESEDIIFIRGEIYREKFYYYVVIAEFYPESLDELKEFNNMKYCFRDNSIWIKDEFKISQMLISIYIDFITSEISEKNKLKQK